MSPVMMCLMDLMSFFMGYFLGATDIDFGDDEEE